MQVPGFPHEFQFILHRPDFSPILGGLLNETPLPDFLQNGPPRVVPHDFRGHAERNGWIGLSSLLSSGLRAGLALGREENTA